MDLISHRLANGVARLGAGSCVAILLSTFNGGRYVSEQLASITAQTYPHWLLYCRDDGSSDQTRQLLEAFADGPGTGRFVAGPQGGRMRSTASFLTLLRTALDGPAAFFAFADQDDVWRPEKLAQGVAALRRLPPGQPALYFCGRTLVDEALQPIAQILKPRRRPGFPSALIQNLAPGCCMMLNRAAAELIDSSTVPDDTWHDWWAYIIVSAYGGSIIAGDTADILYRQHAGNLVGEPGHFWRRSLSAARRGSGPFMTLFWRQIKALHTGPVPLPGHTQAILDTIENARCGSLRTRLAALRIPGLIRQTWIETMLFRLWFLLD